MGNKVWKQITHRAAAFAAAAVLALTPAVSALAPALTAYATEEDGTTEDTTTSTTTPSASDAVTVTISNVDPNLDDDGNATTVVTAYRIIEATYNAYGVTGYQLAEALTTKSSTEEGGTVYTVASLTAGDTSVYVTADEATTIAQAILNGVFTTSSTDEDENTTSSSLLTSVQLTYSSTSSGTSSSESSSTGTYTGSLGAGTWIVLVTETGTTVYNPIVVSNYYTNANSASSLEAGSVDASGDFTVNNETYYAKKTTVELDKSIVTSDSDSDSDSDEDSGSGTTNGTSASVGDVVTFRIETTMPDYSDLYTSAMVSITDILSAGLTLSSSDGTTTFSNGTDDDGNDCAADWSYVTVKVGNETYSVSATTTDEDGTTTTTTNFTVKAYTFSGTETGADSDDAGKTKMVISFDSSFILEHGGETIVITYYALVNSSAATNADPNTNTAGITYTTEYELNENGTQDPGTPDDPTDPDEPDDSDTTYVYSFALEQDAQKVKIASSDEDEDDTDDDSSDNDTTDDTEDDTDDNDSGDASDNTEYEALAGATFGLFSGYPTSTDESSGNLIATMTTETSSGEDSDDSDDNSDGTSSGGTSDDSSDGDTIVSVGTDANGYITFSGLAAGTYYLQEITAPTGYALNETVYQVVISATIDSTTGILESYTVTIAPVTSYNESSGTVTVDDSQKTTTTYNVTSTTDDDGNVTYTATPSTTDSSVNTQLIVNTSLITLPSTGGIGIYVIIAVSLAVVVICAVVVTRRKPDDRAD